MYARGNWFVPTWFGRPALNKPPLTFWLFFAGFALEGVSVAAADGPAHHRDRARHDAARPLALRPARRARRRPPHAGEPGHDRDRPIGHGRRAALLPVHAGGVGVVGSAHDGAPRLVGRLLRGNGRVHAGQGTILADPDRAVRHTGPVRGTAAAAGRTPASAGARRPARRRACRRVLAARPLAQRVARRVVPLLCRSREPGQVPGPVLPAIRARRVPARHPLSLVPTRCRRLVDPAACGRVPRSARGAATGVGRRGPRVPRRARDEAAALRPARDVRLRAPGRLGGLETDTTMRSPRPRS